MEEIRRRFLTNLLKVFDLALVTLSFGAAALLVAHLDKRVSMEEFFSIRIKLSNCIIFFGLLLAWHCVFCSYGLYRSRKHSTREIDILNAMKAVGLCTAGLALGAELFNIRLVKPSFLVFFWALAVVSVSVWRIALRETLDQILRRGRNLRYVLIVGTNMRATEFARKVGEEPERGFRVLGFVDDQWTRMCDFEKQDFRVVCNIEGLAEFLRHNVVDEVAMYLPLRSYYERAAQVAKLCEQYGILMRFDGDIFGLKRDRSRAEEFGGHAYFTTSGSVREWWHPAIKRCFDVVSSLLLLTVFSPVLAAIAIVVMVTSDGPVIYLQERVGLNKRRFKMFKFRTMIPNAEKMIDQLEMLNEVSGPVFKIKNDPRITRVGKFLRRTSLDELPQLLNVLTGDMSLVGPRPLPVRDYQGFSEDWQRRRFSVRPGITCLWQINGRNSIPFEQWMRLDLQYVDEWSLWLDLKILARTIPAVLKGAGAA